MNNKAVANAAARRRIEKNIPMGRAGQADEIARVALFLVSLDAAYFTGTTIVVDGGLSLLVGQGA